MRNTVTLDDALLRWAQELTGLSDCSQLLSQALQALMERGERPTARSARCPRAPAAGHPPPPPAGAVILVDTSVWVDHLRRGEPQLAAALKRLEVAIH